MSSYTYNEDYEKRIEMIDWTWYKDSLLKKTHQQENKEQVIIDNTIEDKKREIDINKKKEALVKDEMLKYRLEINYFVLIFYDKLKKYLGFLGSVNLTKDL